MIVVLQKQPLFYHFSLGVCILSEFIRDAVSLVSWIKRSIWSWLFDIMRLPLWVSTLDLNTSTRPLFRSCNLNLFWHHFQPLRLSVFVFFLHLTWHRDSVCQYERFGSCDLTSTIQNLPLSPSVHVQIGTIKIHSDGKWNKQPLDPVKVLQLASGLWCPGGALNYDDGGGKPDDAHTYADGHTLTHSKWEKALRLEDALFYARTAPHHFTLYIPLQHLPHCVSSISTPQHFLLKV